MDSVFLRLIFTHNLNKQQNIFLIICRELVIKFFYEYIINFVSRMDFFEKEQAKAKLITINILKIILLLLVS